MTRERHVYPTEEIKHLWAQQNKDSARNSFVNHRFEGPTLYSYSTPIANFVKNKKGNAACLITTRRYSVTTTAKHLPHRSDIPPSIPVFCVLHIGATGGRAPYPETSDYHKDNLANFGKLYALELARVARAKHKERNELDYLRSEAQKYCKFFGVRFTPPTFPAAGEDLLEKMRKKALAEAQKRSKETRERKKARQQQCELELAAFIAGSAPLPYDWHRYASKKQRQTHLRFEVDQYFSGRCDTLPINWFTVATDSEKEEIAEKQLKTFCEGEYGQETLRHDWFTYATPEQIARAGGVTKHKTQIAIKRYLAGDDINLLSDWQKYATEQQKEFVKEETIRRWRNAEPQPSIVVCNIGGTLLRIRGDVIQTSRGASFPVSHGVKAWPLIKACKERGEGWQSNGRQIHLGHYGVDRIEPDGTVIAGCHKVAFEEVKLIAHQLGLE